MVQSGLVSSLTGMDAMPRGSTGQVDLPPGHWRDLIDLFRRLAVTSDLGGAAIAQKARLSRSYVSELLNARKAPTPGTSMRLVAALGGSRQEQLRARSLAERLQELRRYEREKPVPTSDGGSGLDRWSVCMAFVSAVDEAHYALREVAQSQVTGDHYGRANRAVHEADVYAKRERFLVAASPEVAAAGEAVFLAVIALRNVVRDGAGLQTDAYHRAYHPFAEALWRFRQTMRADFGQQPLSPEVLHRVDWSDVDRCERCVRRGTGSS